jgi:VWFA-related protein
VLKGAEGCWRVLRGAVLEVLGFRHPAPFSTLQHPSAPSSTLQHPSAPFSTLYNVAVRRHTILLGALLATATVAQSQQSQPPVTFRVDVNYVEVDAVVTDAQGRFVPGLTKDDFELLEEGTPQTINTFALVDLPAPRPDPPLFKKSPIEPDVRSNLDPFDGRIFVIVLDDLHTDFRRTARVRASARQFIERYVGANDLVALVQTGAGARSAQDFTTSRARLFAAIDTFAGRKIGSATQSRIDDYYRQLDMKTGNPPRDTEEGERAHYARNMLRTLRGAAQLLGNIQGRRKAVVWFSEGTDFMTDNPFTAQSSSFIAQEMRDAVAAAERAGVTFYGVDVRGLGAQLDEALGATKLPDDPGVNLGTTAFITEVERAQDFLRTMSEQTGGFAIVNRNDLGAAFEQLVQENSRYYLLGYYPANTRRDGKFRQVRVGVKRPGLEVRARAGYHAPRSNAASTTTEFKDGGASPAVREAIQSPVPVSGLGMRVFAAPFDGPGKNASVAITIEVTPQRLAFVEKDGAFTEELEIVIVPVDAAGKVHDGARDLAPMKLSPPSLEAVRRSGVRIGRRLDLPPGKYQLRVAARAANGNAVGAVIHDLDVPDFSKPPLAVSGVALMSAVTSRIPTPPPAKDFFEVLREVPTATREFGRDDFLGFFAEVYDNRTATPHTVTITSVVTADDGTVLAKGSDVRRSEEVGGTSGGFGHALKMPLKTLRPGRYVLRVEARSSLTDMPAAFREVEFRVR